MPQCKAQSKRSGQQCRRRANIGYEVCMMHGAGTRARPGGAPRGNVNAVVHAEWSAAARRERKAVTQRKRATRAAIENIVKQARGRPRKGQRPALVGSPAASRLLLEGARMAQGHIDEARAEKLERIERKRRERGEK
jgi:hypothetical protein